MGLGSTLREARLRQKLTLEDAENTIKVRRSFLEALEAGRYDLLPAKAYTEGFLRLYARYLGLDPRPLLQELPPEPGIAVTAPTPRSFPSLPSFAIPAWAPAGAGILLLGIIGLAVFQGAANAATPKEPAAVDGDASFTLRRTPTIEPNTENTPQPSATAEPAPAAAPPPTSTPDRSAATATRTPPTPTPVPPTPVPPTATAVSRIAVASVVGLPSSQAVQSLQGAGLEVAQQEQFSNSVAPGRVISQNPAPDTQLQAGGTVTIVISRGPLGNPVPNVIGRTEADARQALIASGLRVFQYTNYQGKADLPSDVLERVCIGCVLSTTPAAGTPVLPGAEVYLAVRKE